MLQVNLLGEQSVTDDTGTVRARSSRALALIGFLVVHADAPQTRQRLAAQFWPDSTDEQALTNLRRELHHVRTVLGDDPSLVVTARDLCWTDSPTCRVDVRSFARFRAAARRRRPRATTSSSGPARARPSRTTAASSSPAATTTGCSPPAASSNSSASTCWT
ncbi:hypothetical protein ACFQV8_14700 [Pseudonocardia benzenivorans]